MVPSKCEKCAVNMRALNCDEPAVCAWYLYNVVCGNGGVYTKRVTYWDDEYGCWSYHCSSGDAANLLAANENIFGSFPEPSVMGGWWCCRARWGIKSSVYFTEKFRICWSAM